jgi:hypothetical protein
MNITLQHINDLLFLHECVVLPDFGGIISNYCASSFEEKTSTFYPPKKELSFNKNLSNNDGLLITYISEKEGVSYEKAARGLSFFVEDLKVKLNRGQRVVFDNIGVFYLDRKFNILFEPFDYNFLADAWGMSKLSLDKEAYAQIVKAPNKIASRLKFGIAAATIGGSMFVVGSNKEDINLNRLEASIGITDLFANNSEEAKAEISPEDELIHTNPFILE